MVIPYTGMNYGIRVAAKNDESHGAVQLLFSTREKAMPRPQSPFVVQRRKNVKTYILTINPSSGVPARICAEWQRKSFQNLPFALVQYRAPKSKASAEAGALEYISRLANRKMVRKDLDYKMAGQDGVQGVSAAASEMA